MSDTEPTFQEVVRALKREYDTLVRDIESRPPGFLGQDSYCTEWKNYQVTSHLGSGSEIFLRSLEAALDGKEPLSDDGRKAIWAHFDSLGPDQVYPEFKDRVGKLLAYLDALPESKYNDIIPTFAGPLPLPKALLTRLNEMALHVWDVRVKQDPKLTLDSESTRLLLPMVIERLPNRAKADGLADLRGQPIGFDVQNGTTRQFTLRPGSEKPSVEEGLPSNALFTVKITPEALERLVSGRLPIDQGITEGHARVSANANNARDYVALNKIFPGY